MNAVQMHKKVTDDGKKSLESAVKFADRYKLCNVSYWNSEDIKSWIASLDFDSKGITLLWKIVDENDLSGASLIKMEASDLAAMFCITSENAKLMHERIKKLDADDIKEDYKMIQSRVREINIKQYPHIQVTNKIEDCIMKDDNPKILRAVMSCGHAIAPSTMFKWIDNTFSNSLKAVNIACPVPTCKTQWDWTLCWQIADMTTEEKFKFEYIRISRLNDEIRYCPFCKTAKNRSEDMELKVKCDNTKCTGGYWCWWCLKEWKTENKDHKIKYCGNKECMFIKDLEKQLQECETCLTSSKDENNNQLPVPHLRACPKCLTISEHISGCKHVTCQLCKTSFCFICCNIASVCKDWSNYQNTTCKPAPRQTFS